MDNDLNQFEDNMEAFDPSNFSEGQHDEGEPTSNLYQQFDLSKNQKNQTFESSSNSKKSALGSIAPPLLSIGPNSGRTGSASSGFGQEDNFLKNNIERGYQPSIGAEEIARFNREQKQLEQEQKRLHGQYEENGMFDDKFLRESKESAQNQEMNSPDSEVRQVSPEQHDRININSEIEPKFQGDSPKEFEEVSDPQNQVASIEYNQDDEDLLIQVSIERHSRKKSRDVDQEKVGMVPEPILDDSPEIIKGYPEVTESKQDEQDADSNDNDEEICVEDDDRSLESIDKLQNLLSEINDTCIESLKNEETENALDCLKRAEQILEDYTNEGKDVDRNMIIIILYNQACCYQRMSMLDDCSNYLDGTIYNLQQKLLGFEDQEQEIKDMIQQTDLDDYGMPKKRGNNAYAEANAYGMDQEDTPQDPYGYPKQEKDVEKASDASNPESLESSKKLSVSQKLFKLRYLAKCHLQLCAVQSQLNKHQDALHHGQMASIYCQELIRNTQILCESYVGEILLRGDQKKDQNQLQGDVNKGEQKEEDSVLNQLNDNYYLEDDKGLLDILIKNSHPILTDLVSQVNNFNTYNVFSKRSSKINSVTGGPEVQSEFDQDLHELLDNKTQFEITSEAKENLERFQKFKDQQKSKGISMKQTPSKGALIQELDGGRVSDFTKPSKSSRKAKQQQFQRQFVDEMAPGSDSVKNQFDQQKQQIYSAEGLDTSLTSTGTYGQKHQPTALSGFDSRDQQNYVKLKNNVKTVLVTQEEDDWIFNLNIGNVMHLQPLSTEEMNLHVDNSHELSRDAMLQKIILLTVSYFCVGTELRFLNNASDDSKNKGSSHNEKRSKKEQSEMWHAQALEASARFLPSECPLVAHVITNYQKHHSPALTAIPEDEPLDEDLKVIRPLNEVKNDNINYYQIIRNHMEPQPRMHVEIKKEQKAVKSYTKIEPPDLNFEEIFSEKEEEPLQIQPQPQVMEKISRQSDIETKSIDLFGAVSHEQLPVPSLQDNLGIQNQTNQNQMATVQASEQPETVNSSSSHGIQQPPSSGKVKASNNGGLQGNSKSGRKLKIKQKTPSNKIQHTLTKNLSVKDSMTKTIGDKQFNPNVGLQTRMKMMPGNKSTKQLSSAKQLGKVQGVQGRPNMIPPSSKKNFGSTTNLKATSGSTHLLRNQISNSQQKLHFLKIMPSSPGRMQPTGSQSSFNSLANKSNMPKGIPKLGSGGRQTQPREQNQLRGFRSPSGQGQLSDRNKQSIAQNIQKITQVLSQKISNMGFQQQPRPQQSFNRNQNNSPFSPERLGNTDEAFINQQEDDFADEVNNLEAPSDELPISNRMMSGSQSPQRQPQTQNRNRQLHNIPKVSGSNLMIQNKSKTQMNFNSQLKNMMNFQNKNYGQQHLRKPVLSGPRGSTGFGPKSSGMALGGNNKQFNQIGPMTNNFVGQKNLSPQRFSQNQLQMGLQPANIPRTTKNQNAPSLTSPIASEMKNIEQLLSPAAFNNQPNQQYIPQQQHRINQGQPYIGQHQIAFNTKVKHLAAIASAKLIMPRRTSRISRISRTKGSNSDLIQIRPVEASFINQIRTKAAKEI